MPFHVSGILADQEIEIGNKRHLVNISKLPRLADEVKSVFEERTWEDEVFLYVTSN